MTGFWAGTLEVILDRNVNGKRAAMQQASLACWWLALVLSAICRFCAAEPLPTPENFPPKSPQESLRAMVARPGFKVELMAAEPLVMDPIDIAWGPDGKAWVVEMADYPLGIDGRGKPGGRVRWLQDTNGDAVYDRSVVFLDGLSFPTGVMPWRPVSYTHLTLPTIYSV
mgnify:CR=1 FL=1